MTSKEQKKRSLPIRILRWTGIGVGGFFALIIVIAIATAIFGGGNSKTKAATKTQATRTTVTTTTSASPKPPAPKPAAPKEDPSAEAARNWITKHGDVAHMVAAEIAKVKVALKSNDPYVVAEAAQNAHDQLDLVRDTFPYGDSGDLKDAEGNVMLGANDLKNSMGAFVAAMGDTNPATIAHASTQYKNAADEWNSGVLTIWQLAHRLNADPPII